MDQRTHELIRANEQLQREIADRKQAEAALASRLRYEAGLAACLQTLLVDQTGSLNEALEQLLAASQASRVYILENFEVPALGVCMRQSYEVCAPGITPEINNPALQHLPYRDRFERWRERLAAGRSISGSVASFPDRERELLEPQGRRPGSTRSSNSTSNGPMVRAGSSNCWSSRSGPAGGCWPPA